MKSTILVLLAVSLAALSGCGKKHAVQPTGTKAPDFTLKGFDDKEVSLSDFKGKIVVLEWFSNRCPFVQYHYEKASTMIDLANKYKDQGVVWLAIDSTSFATDREVKDFAAKHSIPYPILDDRQGDVGRAYGAKTTPHMFVIDKQGNIVYKGAIDNAPLGESENGLVNYVDKALAELTSGEAVSTAETRPYGCNVKYPN